MNVLGGSQLDAIKSKVLRNPLQYSFPLASMREKSNVFEPEVTEALRTSEEGKEVGSASSKG